VSFESRSRHVHDAFDSCGRRIARDEKFSMHTFQASFGK